MSAFDYNLVAISQSGGLYSIASQTNGALDVTSLQRDGLLHDVSDDTGYIDRAAILQTADIPKYFISGHDANSEMSMWLTSLPRSVVFIVFHAAEFETGLSD